MKHLTLFTLVSVFTGAAAVVASMVGASFGHHALFAGAILGGFAGVTAAIRLSATFRLIEPAAVWPGILGGWIGFLIAAPLAAANAHTPVIPLLSIGLVGAGTLAAMRISPHKPKS